MRIVGIKLVDDYHRKHVQAKGALQSWVNEIRQAKWKHMNDLKARYPSADYYDGMFIFNINGNNHRLVAQTEFVAGVVVVKWIGTHAEYNRKNKNGGFKL